MVNYGWLDHEAILTITYIGEIDEEALRKSIATVHDYLQATPHKVYLLGDWRAASGFPLNYSMISPILALAQDPRCGAVAFVGGNTFIDFWATLVVRMSGIHYRPCSTVSEGEAYLRTFYSTGKLPVAVRG